MRQGALAGIAYSARGDGAPVVCLHGIGADSTSFAHQMGAFPGFRVIAWNMPGYGGSPPEEPMTFAGLSERLARFIEAKGAERVHLVGQSMGGMIALEHACRHPAQVASLALVATTARFGGRDDSFKEAFLKARLAPLAAGETMAEMARAAAPQLVGPKTPKDEISRIAEAMARVSETTWRSVLKCLVTFDRAHDLASIDVPALLVAGSEDRNAPARTMEKMANRMPNAQFHELEGAGHMVHQEMPERFNALLLEFLKRFMH